MAKSNINLLSDELTEQVKEATRRALYSLPPTPLSPRYPRRGGGVASGGGDDTAYLAIVSDGLETCDIPARSGSTLGSQEFSGGYAGSLTIYRGVDGSTSLEAYQTAGVGGTIKLLNACDHDVKAGAFTVMPVGDDSYRTWLIYKPGLKSVSGYGNTKSLGTSATGEIQWFDRSTDSVPAFYFSYSTLEQLKSAVNTDELLKCSSNDTTAKYAEGVFPDSGTYESGKDLLVNFQTLNDGANETMRAHVERQDITGYAGANTAHLGLAALVSDGIVWLAVTVAASKSYALKVTTDASAVPTVTAVEADLTKDSYFGVSNGVLGFHELSPTTCADPT